MTSPRVLKLASSITVRRGTGKASKSHVFPFCSYALLEYLLAPSTRSREAELPRVPPLSSTAVLVASMAN